jgi:hypothetical protein
MAYAWQSVEEAAVTLGISTRTLHRRISKGEVETRLESGRREVLVCLPDDEPEVEVLEETVVMGQPTYSAPQSAPPHQATPPSPDGSMAIVLAQKEVALANEKVRRTELALAAFQHTSNILQEEARRTRVSARCAWAAVAVLSIGVYVAVGWTASKVTEFRILNANLTQQLKSTEQSVEQRTEELERFRKESETAKQAAAKMEGELSVTRATLSAKRPATQPSLLERLAKLAGE